MTLNERSDRYRELIDALVRECREGQGQVAANNVRRGVWNQSARDDFLEDQHEVNSLLAKLTERERGVLARLCSESFVAGVFGTLKTLEWFEVSPFHQGYEGGAGEDFIGRLQDWEWPGS